MGPGRAHGKGLSMAWLTGSVAGIGQKKTCASMGALFIGWDY